jgi:hypothetical protein
MSDQDFWRQPLTPASWLQMDPEDLQKIEETKTIAQLTVQLESTNTLLTQLRLELQAERFKRNAIEKSNHQRLFAVENSLRALLLHMKQTERKGTTPLKPSKGYLDSSEHDHM